MFSLLSRAQTVAAIAAVKAAVTATSSRQLTVSSVTLGRGIFAPDNNGLRKSFPRARPPTPHTPGTKTRKLWRTEKKPTKWQLAGPVKQRGILCPDSTFVTRGEKLVNQIGLLYLPGLNVTMTPSFTLLAMEHGRVFVTTEKLDPNWDHVFNQNFYKEYKDTDVPIYKTYVHVIPAPMPQKFNLVEQF